MNVLATTALILAVSVSPALAQDMQGQQRQSAAEGLNRQSVMGSDVYSSDGQSIGQVVDVLETPEGELVAVAVVDPNDPAVGLALPAEMLAQKDGRLTADISTDEIAALPEPEESEDPALQDQPQTKDTNPMDP